MQVNINMILLYATTTTTTINNYNDKNGTWKWR